jgi:hypothetical protein
MQFLLLRPTVVRRLLLYVSVEKLFCVPSRHRMPVAAAGHRLHIKGAWVEGMGWKMGYQIDNY